MLALFVSKLRMLGALDFEKPRMFKITRRSDLPLATRADLAFLCEPSAHVDEQDKKFGLYLLRGGDLLKGIPNRNGLLIDQRLDYLDEGDVIRVDPANTSIKTVWRRKVHSNAFLVTERCNSFCIMCSQPPRDVDDGFLLDEMLDAIPFVDQSATEICITGGEPTLYGERFVRLIRTLKLALPATAVHVLSNGRTFENEEFAKSISAVEHPDLMFGIPIYSDVAHIHDFVVQAEGAFDETLRGILNLKRHGTKVEIRIVIHRQTMSRLPELAQFIARNLLFVDHVALMGLEVTGFARANLQALTVDPSEYVSLLARAVNTLSRAGIRTSIYNHPLCALPQELWSFAVKSISNWKNEYMMECESCRVRSSCGGFFATSRSNPNFLPKPFNDASAIV